MEFYAAERRSSYICHSMDGTGKHYAKGNKPGGERQIPYDLTFNRNLMNKQTSKQNITKDTEIEKRPTVTTPEGRGEGISGGKVITGKKGKGQEKEHE